MSGPGSDLLRGTPLFADLDAATLDTLSSDFIQREFASGAMLAEEGQGGLNFFVVESGEAVVKVGGEEVGRIGPGGSFGEVALVDKSARSATIEAVSAMKTHALPVWSFRSFVETRPDVSWKLLEILADRLRTAEAR